MQTVSTAWAEGIVEECIEQGVDHWVLCPGSRNTPLTAAIAKAEGVTRTTHFDERGAAFYALGLARATGRPAAIVVTSGSAVANLFPAVVEAAADALPLLLLTADRPPELVGCGANQAIDQTKIFAGHAGFFDLGAPRPDCAVKAVRSTVAWACQEALKGPVQINVPFNKPLGLLIQRQ